MMTTQMDRDNEILDSYSRFLGRGRGKGEGGVGPRGNEGWRGKVGLSMAGNG